jgi:putative ABC transport system permease protein
MFRHQLTIIFRTFRRNKVNFFINLLGLSLGLACSLLIYLWVYDELRVDKFHKNNDRLYQVMVNLKQSNGITTDVNCPALLSEDLAQNFPEVKYAANTTGNFQLLMLTANEKHFQPLLQFASKDYFNVFVYKLVVGDKDHVLANKNAMLLSETQAKKMFGSVENSIGKTIRWDYLNMGSDCIVSGVFQDVPANSSEQFDCVLSFESYKELGANALWGNFNAQTFVVLNKGVSADQFSKKIAGEVKKHDPGSSNTSLFTRPYSSKYLYDKYENGVVAGGRIEYVRLFSIIAIFILVIACINFMNLSTARAATRLKEVGIKKVVGAQRWDLALQYLSEALLLVIFAFVVAMALVIISLSQFNMLTGKHLSLHFETNLVLSAIGILLFTGLVAGSYPAFYLSGFRPVAILKNKLKSSVGELMARKGLVVFQFMLSIVLIVAVLVCSRQIEYIQTTNLGYTRDNVVYIKIQGNIPKHLVSFLAELKNTPGVRDASSMTGNITEDGNSTGPGGITWSGQDPKALISFEYREINYDFIETLGMSMKEGRSFSRSFGDDSAGLLFNETAIKAMGLQNPVGKQVMYGGVKMHIIGIVKDFHFQSFHEAIKPLVFQLVPGDNDKIVAKLGAGQERAAMEGIEKLYKEYNPRYPFEYKFMDEDFQAVYAAERRVGVLSGYFAGLAIFISALGLFGLATFTVERRQKEIGIRKVLGSGAFNIFVLLSKDFIQLILIAIVIALPASYLLTKDWLDGFAYRIDLSIWYFLLAGCLALAIAWLTVAMQALKAAYSNPLNSLKRD